MATVLQERLAKQIVKNSKRKRPLNKQELVVSSGYGAITADRHASEVIAQVGVQEELRNMGFTTEGAKAVVESILYDKRVKPETRINAAKEVFKVTGGYAPEKSVRVNLTEEIPAPITELAKKLNGRGQ